MKPDGRNRRRRDGPAMWAIAAAGFIPGAVRGVTEAFRLYAGYPCPHGPASLAALALQCGLAYGIVAGGAGIVLGLLLWWSGIFRGNRLTATLAGVLITVIAIDLIGWNSPLPADTHSFDTTPRTDSNPQRPDVLLITLDTCRADHLPAYGYPGGSLPTLDMLFRRGTLFTDTVCGIPVTTPSHVTIFTGRYPAGHGSRFNAVPVGPGTETLTDILAARGYRTGAFVSAFPVIHEVSGLGRGFQLFDQLLTPRKLEPLFYRTTLIRPMTRFGRFRPAERPAGDTVDSVLSWWRQTPADTPRFTWVHLYDAHAPYRPEPPFQRIFGDTSGDTMPAITTIVTMNRNNQPPSPATVKRFTRLYDGELARIDRAVNRLVTALARQKRLDNTLIILTADHGESLDEHGYYFSHGDHLYEPSLHVPLALILPGRIPGGGVIPGATGLVDIFATTLDLLNLQPSDHPSEGRSLLPFIRNRAAAPADYYCESGAGVYTCAHSPSNERIRAKERAIRTSRDKLIIFPDADSRYFDLISDPGEQHPVTTPGSERRAHLLLRLSDTIRRTDPPERQPPRLPDPASLEQLRALGYVNGS